MSSHTAWKFLVMKLDLTLVQSIRRCSKNFSFKSSVSSSDFVLEHLKIFSSSHIHMKFTNFFQQVCVETGMVTQKFSPISWVKSRLEIFIWVFANQKSKWTWVVEPCFHTGVSQINTWLRGRWPWVSNNQAGVWPRRRINFESNEFMFRSNS